MNAKSESYLARLTALYETYPDNGSLTALAEVSEQANRARELTIYQEQDKTKELIKAARDRFKVCIDKLTDPERKMTDLERERCFATMDWCRFTLDIVGEDPKKLDEMVDNIILGYARKAGFTD